MNPENRNQVIIFAVLLAALGGAVYYFVLAPGDAGGKKGGAGSADAAAVEAYANIQTAFIQDEVDVVALQAQVQDVRFDYSQAHETRNPMKPLVGTNPELESEDSEILTGESGEFADEDLLYFASNLAFTGVIYDPVLPLAIIGNEMAYVGYSFDEVRGLIIVKEIHEDNVVLEVRLQEGPIEHVQRLKEPEAL